MLLREPANQSPANLRTIEEMEQYWTESPGSANAKLENFTKYVGREALTKFLARTELFLKQLHVHGSIVELGVARGASLMTWVHLSEIYEPVNYTREIIGFDTFAGIPTLDERDITFEGRSSMLETGGFLVEPGMKTDIERALRIHNLTRYLAHISKVLLVEGDIEETLPTFLSRNPHLIVSLLHIDVDIYKSTKKGLELLLSRVPKGGLIVFDEINNRKFPGETIALHEVLGISSLRIQRLHYCPCVSYVVIE
jgi:Macrocin-O-methyltransferase (TylF)